MENKHEPAYPIKQITFDNRSKKFVGAGLTKRELIAAMAMQGLCNKVFDQGAQSEITTYTTSRIAKITTTSILIADALLEQLNKG